jgi:DNA-binding transcriptional LysR family regulator
MDPVTESTGQREARAELDPALPKAEDPNIFDHQKFLLIPMSKIVDWDSRIGRRLRLRDLHVFFTVVQTGSLAKAAATLHVSQPAVSQLIIELERVVGAKLFDRGPRGVTPTIYGRALLARGQSAFDELRQGVQEIEFLADPTAGEMKVGCQEAIAAILAPAIEGYAQRYPGVVLDIYEEEFDRYAARLRNRSLDFVLQRLRDPVRPDDPFFDDLNVELLFNDRMVVAAGMRSPWARRRKIKLAELIDEPWILSPPDTTNYRAIVGAFRAQGLAAPRIGLKTLSTHLRANLVGSGKFIAPFPNTVFSFYAERFALKALPVALPIWPWPVVILTLKNRTLSPVVQLFLGHLREFFAARTREGEGRKRGA